MEVGIMGYKRGNKGATLIENKTPKAPEPVIEEKVEEVVNDVAEEETTTEVIEEVKTEEAPVEVFGIVDGVDMALNIRKDPEIIPNNQIAILGKGTKIIVVDANKTVKNKDGEWYKIRIVDKDPKDLTGNGYAMKKYIKII